MNKIDLHKEFVKALFRKVPKRVDLVNLLSGILYIEKEPASRRLSGKVLFTIREMGILARYFQISIDQLLHQEEEDFRIPMQLSFPMKTKSIESLCDMIDVNYDYLAKIGEKPAESGNVYGSLPIDFFITYPYLRKFMFFKWGHYFIGTEEFDNFARWNIPERLVALPEKFQKIGGYKELYYIWDSNLIWSLVGEIDFFHKMHAITTEERDLIRRELKELLSKLEGYLKGVQEINLFQCKDIQFYITNLNLGFTCSNNASEDLSMTVFQTNFTFAQIENCHKSFIKVKEWMKSLQSISVQISQSARIERRLFFEKQNKIIDTILK